MSQLDLFRGLAAGRRGQELTLDAEDARWFAIYADLAERFLRQLPDFAVFAMEDCKVWCLSNGLFEPHHVNCWGAAGRRLVNRWKRDGKITLAGARTARLDAAHGRMVRTYHKAGGW